MQTARMTSGMAEQVMGVSTVRTGLGATIRFWLRNARTRAALRDLPENLCADAGLTLEQARQEGRKHFWMR